MKLTKTQEKLLDVVAFRAAEHIDLPFKVHGKREVNAARQLVDQGLVEWTKVPTVLVTCRGREWHNAAIRSVDFTKK